MKFLLPFSIRVASSSTATPAPLTLPNIPIPPFPPYTYFSSKPPTNQNTTILISNFTFFRSTHNVTWILCNVKIVYHTRKVQQRRRSFTFMYVAVVGKRRFNGGFVRAKSFSVTAKSNKCLKILSIKRKKV